MATSPVAPPPYVQFASNNTSGWSASPPYVPFAPNSTDAVHLERCGNALPTWGVPFGVILSTVASIGINIGQNMQAQGINRLTEEQKSAPQQSRLWVIGMLVFIFSSLFNFVALAFAPASILTPIESIQFVTNIMYNRVYNGAPVSPLMVTGVTCAVVGTCLTVFFGAQGEKCFQGDYMEGLWRGPAWLVYFIGTMIIAIVTYFVHACMKARADMDAVYAQRTAILRPVLYTLSASLAGGSQVITHSKGLSSLLTLAFQGDVVGVFTDWPIYVELFITVAAGILWVQRQTLGLGLFDPLIILPLLIGSFIVTGGISGGIFFGEFDFVDDGRLGWANWILYILGMVLVVVGLAIIAIAGTQLQRARAKAAGKDNGKEGPAASGAELGSPVVKSPKPESTTNPSSRTAKFTPTEISLPGENVINDSPVVLEDAWTSRIVDSKRNAAIMPNHMVLASSLQRMASSERLSPFRSTRARATDVTTVASIPDKI
eukprot:jgi/Chrpa1/4652/Chrysochromulina_OHIO_Genome00018068-RA